MTIYPLPFRFTNNTMVPVHVERAAKQYIEGETYTLVPHEERSIASHRAYFAAVREAWKNLPEGLSDQFPTELHLRKWALIKAGYRDERTFVCSTKAEALQLSSFIKPIDDYAVVVPRNATVTVLTAKSQSLKAMGRAEFQRSKDDVLAVVASVVSVPSATLQREAGKAA